MMKEYITKLGTVKVGSSRELLMENLKQMAAVGKGGTVGLTGGSTPKAVYELAVSEADVWKKSFREVNWFTSDERYVPLESDESNFGNAQRLMLDPLGVSSEQQFPWKVDLEPSMAAEAFASQWREHFGDERCFDLCLLGMGEDCHTLSLFPGSPLLQERPNTWFSFVDVPGKGWRLTLTPAGLERCGKVVISVMGKGKCEALCRVFTNTENLMEMPVQLLGRMPEQVCWLVDEAAADGLW